MGSRGKRKRGYQWQICACVRLERGRGYVGRGPGVESEPEQVTYFQCGPARVGTSGRGCSPGGEELAPGPRAKVLSRRDSGAASGWLTKQPLTG